MSWNEQSRLGKQNKNDGGLDDHAGCAIGVNGAAPLAARAFAGLVLIVGFPRRRRR